MNVVVSVHLEYETFVDQIFHNMQQDDAEKNLLVGEIQDAVEAEEATGALGVHHLMLQSLQRLNVINVPLPVEEVAEEPMLRVVLLVVVDRDYFQLHMGWKVKGARNAFDLPMRVYIIVEVVYSQNWGL